MRGLRLLVHGWQRGAYPTEGVSHNSKRKRQGHDALHRRVSGSCCRLARRSADERAVFFRDEGRSRRDSTVGIVRRDLMSGRETDLYREIAPPPAARLARSPDGRLLAFCMWDRHTDTDPLNVMSLSARHTAVSRWASFPLASDERSSPRRNPAGRLGESRRCSQGGESERTRERRR